MALGTADNATALTAAQGITAALFKRERTGEGEHVRIAMLDASVAFLWPEAFARQTMMDAPGANEPQHYTRDIIYTTKDKQYIVAGTNTESEWLGLCRALESVNPGLAEDPRFLTGALRSKNVQERYETVDEAIGHFDQADVLARLQAEDVPSSPVNHPRSQVFDDPQVRANELLFETEHPSAGRLLQPRGAAEFVSSPFQPSLPGSTSNGCVGLLPSPSAASDPTMACRNSRVRWRFRASDAAMRRLSRSAGSFSICEVAHHRKLSKSTSPFRGGSAKS